MTTTPEALTPEERRDIEADIRDAFAFHETGRGDPPNVSAVIADKLLRIHDQQVARIEELEKQVALFIKATGFGEDSPN